jgi:hypothetical protein
MHSICATTETITYEDIVNINVIDYLEEEDEYDGQDEKEEKKQVAYTVPKANAAPIGFPKGVCIGCIR